MDISGSFAFSISDKKLDFKDIEDRFPIKPTKVIKKGQMVGRIKNIEAPYDIWIYEISIEDSENTFNGLSLLLNDLLPYSRFIKEAKVKYGNISINCYIRSDYGQIGFRLSNEIIMKLESIGLCLDFHIFSYGAVKD